MVKSREIRGFKILKSTRKGALSLKLFAQNGSRFMVMLSRYFMGIPLKRKLYPYDNLKDAEYHYEKLFSSKMRGR